MINLLCKLRDEEKFEQCQKLLKQVYEILNRLGLETSIIEADESINKIIRNLAAKKNEDHKKTTTVEKKVNKRKLFKLIDLEINFI